MRCILLLDANWRDDPPGIGVALIRDHCAAGTGAGAGAGAGAAAAAGAGAGAGDGAAGASAGAGLTSVMCVATVSCELPGVAGVRCTFGCAGGMFACANSGEGGEGADRECAGG